MNISPSKIADSIGVSLRTVQRLASTGLIPGAEKRGYHYVYPDSRELKVWIRRMKKAARGNQSGVSTRTTYERSTRQVIIRAMRPTEVFLQWLEKNSARMPGGQASDWSPEQLRNIPRPKSASDRRLLEKGAQELRALAKIAKHLVAAGVFSAPSPQGG